MLRQRWKSCCKHKADTVICSAHKLALHIFPVCGSAGSPEVQSSTQQHEVAQTAATEGTHTKTLFCWDCEEFVLQQNVYERQNTISKHVRKLCSHRETISTADPCICYTHTTEPHLIKWLMHYPSPQLAENEGRTKISCITSYLVEALSRC